jgi:hypothetical protein
MLDGFVRSFATAVRHESPVARDFNPHIPPAFALWGYKHARGRSRDRYLGLIQHSNGVSSAAAVTHNLFDRLSSRIFTSERRKKPADEMNHFRESKGRRLAALGEISNACRVLRVNADSVWLLVRAA